MVFNNHSLHKDLRIQIIPGLASYYKNLHSDTRNHPNLLISNLHNTTNSVNPLRHLKRDWAKNQL